MAFEYLWRFGVIFDVLLYFPDTLRSLRHHVEAEVTAIGFLEFHLLH
jgi:hypothetical protein